MKKVVTDKQVETVDLLVTDYLQQNPKIKKALSVFNLSKIQYSASLQARRPNHIITSNKTELNNGNLARNQ